MINKGFICFLFLLILASCDDKSNKIYFGGKVSSNNQDFIFVENNSGVFDSLEIDKNGLFGAEIDINNGLLDVKYGSDQIQIYTEKNDSLAVYFNGYEMSESIAFSGKGAEKNNYLMRIYRENKRHPFAINGFSYLDQGSFLKNIDSARKEYKKIWEEYNQNNEFSSEFDDFAEIHAKLPFYSALELYPILHFENTKNRVEAMKDSSGYYAFRDSLDLLNTSFDDDERMVYYLESFLINVSGKEYYKKEGVSKESYFETKFKELKKIEALPILKEQLAIKMFYEELDAGAPYNELEEELKEYYEFIQSDKSKEVLKKLLTRYKEYSKNEKIQNFEFFNKGVKTNLMDVLNSETSTKLIFLEDNLEGVKNMSLFNSNKNYKDNQLIIFIVKKKHNYINNIPSYIKDKVLMEYTSLDELQNTIYVPKLPYVITLDKEGRYK